MDLAAFNDASDAGARELLDACLDIDPWVDEVASGRPYPTLEALQGKASEASAKISWEQVATALARHPRIGEKSTGSAADAALSLSEQAGVANAQVDDFAAGNRAYEDRFGHIFLICASGLSGDQMLAALRTRMTNDPENRARGGHLRTAQDRAPPTRESGDGMIDRISTHILNTTLGVPPSAFPASSNGWRPAGAG